MYIDLTGKRFGRLIVIEKGRLVNHKILHWVCKCDCGTIKEIRGSSLKNKLTTSCGCYCKEIHWKGYGDLSGEYWSVIKLGAKKRNLEFNITIEEAWHLFVHQNKKCLLTGRPIFLVRNYSKGKIRQTASLDRIYSTKGYLIDNICWTHKDINIFKSAMSNQDFIALCYEVTNYQETMKSVLTTASRGV